MPADFGRRLGSRREAVVQVIVDGADNNTATIAMSYVSQITQAYSSSVILQQMEDYFCAAVSTQDKKLSFLGWTGPDEALKLIKEGETSFKKSAA